MRPAATTIVAAAAALLVATAVVAAPADFVARGGASVDSGSDTVDHVLIISLPNVEWADIVDSRLPNLQRLFAASSIGALITNGVDRPSPIGNSYVTLGAGTRAVANGETAGQGFGVDEDFGRDRAGRVFSTRTGTRPGRGIVYMPIADVVERNDEELYGADVGLLGDELARAGVARRSSPTATVLIPALPRTGSLRFGAARWPRSPRARAACLRAGSTAASSAPTAPRPSGCASITTS